jgi:hypothetical protein
MPICGMPTRKGTPCRNRVSACWRHRKLWQTIVQNRSFALVVGLASLVLTITGTASWHQVAKVFESTPVTKQMLEAERGPSTQEHLLTRDSVTVTVHRAGTPENK